MKNKIILIVSIGVIILVFILSIFIIRYNTKKQNTNEKQELYNYYYDNDREYELIQKVCEKDGDWKNYPLTSNFLAKYNEKDGIFGDMQFDKVEVNPYKEGEYHFAYTSHIVVTQGLKKTAYIFYQQHSKERENSPKYEQGLEDVVITDIIPLTDEKGNKLDDRYVFNEKKKLRLVKNIIDVDKNLQDSVATTLHFRSKYPHFLDLFIHYSPLSFNKIKFIENESDLDNNIAIFEVDSILECKRRKYKVKLILDDKLYLDDCEVELLEETTYKGNSNDSSAKALYLNSNLENTNLTDDFIKELKSKGSYHEDINDIDIDYPSDEECINNVDYSEYIRNYKMKNGAINSYYVKYNIEKDGKFSNITSKRLEYQNMTAKEVAKIYLEEKNKQ